MQKFAQRRAGRTVQHALNATGMVGCASTPSNDRRPVHEMSDVCFRDILQGFTPGNIAMCIYVRALPKKSLGDGKALSYQHRVSDHVANTTWMVGCARRTVMAQCRQLGSDSPQAAPFFLVLGAISWPDAELQQLPLPGRVYDPRSGPLRLPSITGVLELGDYPCLLELAHSAQYLAHHLRRRRRICASRPAPSAGTLNAACAQQGMETAPPGVHWIGAGHRPNSRALSRKGSGQAKSRALPILPALREAIDAARWGT